jgi:hypothetical protein
MLQEQGFYTTLSLSEMGSGKYTIFQEIPLRLVLV